MKRNTDVYIIKLFLNKYYLHIYIHVQMTLVNQRKYERHDTITVNIIDTLTMYTDGEIDQNAGP